MDLVSSSVRAQTSSDKDEREAGCVCREPCAAPPIARGIYSALDAPLRPLSLLSRQLLSCRAHSRQPALRSARSTRQRTGTRATSTRSAPRTRLRSARARVAEFVQQLGPKATRSLGRARMRRGCLARPLLLHGSRGRGGDRAGRHREGAYSTLRAGDAVTQPAGASTFDPARLRVAVTVHADRPAFDAAPDDSLDADEETACFSCCSSLHRSRPILCRVRPA